MPCLLEVLHVSALVPSHMSTLTGGQKVAWYMKVYPVFILVMRHLADQANLGAAQQTQSPFIR